MSEPQKFRDRKFVAVLYPEDPTHVACIDKLKSGGYNFAGILHDEDIYEDGDNKGEKKKPHWHIVIKFKKLLLLFLLIIFSVIVIGRMICFGLLKFGTVWRKPSVILQRKLSICIKGKSCVALPVKLLSVMA